MVICIGYCWRGERGYKLRDVCVINFENIYCLCVYVVLYLE